MIISVCWLKHDGAKHNEYRIWVVFFGPYNRYQLHKHNQMTVAKLNSHSITQYPADGSKLLPTAL